LRKVVCIYVIFSFWLSLTNAQERDTSNTGFGIIQGEDTLIHKNIREVIVIPQREFKNRRIERRYWRYAAKVKKVYPLAVKARELLDEYEPVYNSLEDKKEKRKLMKKLENQLLAEHKDELKKWSISDGRILLKLINRETERTPYSLIRDFRGEFSAFFWQGVARIFKNDLKAGYEPEGKDLWLEEIVTLIELGYI
jgi:hypothetical protein